MPYNLRHACPRAPTPFPRSSETAPLELLSTLPDPDHEKLEALNSIAREEINYRRSREQHIFAWSSAILVGVITAMLVADIKAGTLLATCLGKAVATVLTLTISFGSAQWQMKQKRLLAEIQKVSSRVMTRMGLLDLKQRASQDTITDGKWKKWGARSHTWGYHICHPGKIVTTCLLGVAAILTIWSGSWIR